MPKGLQSPSCSHPPAREGAGPPVVCCPLARPCGQALREVPAQQPSRNSCPRPNNPPGAGWGRSPRSQLGSSCSPQWAMCSQGEIPAGAPAKPRLDSWPTDTTTEQSGVVRVAECGVISYPAGASWYRLLCTGATSFLCPTVFPGPASQASPTTPAAPPQLLLCCLSWLPGGLIPGSSPLLYTCDPWMSSPSLGCEYQLLADDSPA